jgi:hypothetical protein
LARDKWPTLTNDEFIRFEGSQEQGFLGGEKCALLPSDSLTLSHSLVRERERERENVCVRVREREREKERERVCV